VAIDLDNLRLIDSAGNDILKNGNFARGGDFWFYSSDRYHLPWHAKNLFLNVYFDQGLFGLTTLALLVSYALIRLIRRAVSGNQDSVVILASIAGFLVVGMFDSLLDVPRIATLFFLVLCIALQRVGRKPVRSA
jgi:O-antigen ligase